MKIPAIFWIICNKYVFRLFHIHTGFNDRSLIWLVNYWPLDILFMKIETKFDFKKLYANKDKQIFNIFYCRVWNNLMFKLYRLYTKKKKNDNRKNFDSM